VLWAELTEDRPAVEFSGYFAFGTAHFLAFRAAGVLQSTFHTGSAEVAPSLPLTVLLCTDLGMAPLDIIRLYAWRFKIEAGFWQAIHTVGAYAYHFWMRAMTPLRRRQGNQYLHRASAQYRQAIRRKFAAYERHIQIGLIAQGLLQYLALVFPRVAWRNFNSYIRTAKTDKAPSEWVVTYALRNTWPDFLRFSPQAITLKKFLARKIALQRASNRQIFELDLAA
jgi:hypothetical protein